MEDLVVSVGADVTGFLSKIDAAKAKVNQLTETQEDLKEVVKDLNTSLRLNEKELTNATVKLQKLNTTTKDGKAAAAILRTEIGQLAQNSKELSGQLNTAKANLSKTTQELKVSTAELKKTEKASTGFGASIGKAYAGLRTLANIIPGLGISSIFLLAFEAVKAFVSALENANKAQEALNVALAEAGASVAGEVANMRSLISIAKDTTLSYEARTQAINQLNKEYPELHGNLTLENIGTKKITDSINKQIDAIVRRSRVKALEKLIDEESAKVEKARVEGDIARNKERASQNSSFQKSVNKLAEALGAPGLFLDVSDAADHFNDIIEEGNKKLDLYRKTLNELNTEAANTGTLFTAVPTHAKKAEKAIKPVVDELTKVHSVLENIAVAAPPALDFSKVTELDPKKLQDAVDSAVAAGKKIAASIAAEIRAAFEAEVARGLADIVTGIGEAIGNALSGKGNVLTNIFQSVFDIVGNFLIQLGKATIVASELVQSISKLVANPAAGFVAGVAAVIAGTILKNIKIAEFATGGYVSGPGGPKSDSIPARLSNGEYVMSAATVSRFGKSFFDMLNGGGRPRNGGFADGGPVHSIGGGQLITVNVVGKFRGKDIYFANREAGSMIGRAT